jgi:acetyl-CoA carboxylase carboxyltransferase component
MAFHLFGKLSGLVPLVGVNSGRCFAGNAAILGCCDVIIATANSNIGMGGPAMIEGGGLGVFRPEEVGPMGIQVPNGVVDIAVADEAEGVRVAKKYLSYFQGPISEWECTDQRLLRRIIPENRLRIYDVRAVIETLADTGSVLELRPHYGLGMVTSFIRIEGRPLGVIANNPRHLSRVFLFYPILKNKINYLKIILDKRLWMKYLGNYIILHPGGNSIEPFRSPCPARPSA